MEVRPAQGFEHLGYAEVWLHAVDEATLLEASVAARALGKTHLEVWTTDETLEVASFLAARGFATVRSYVVSELDVGAAPHPDPPGFPLTTLAARPDLVGALYDVALVAYPDQPGRGESKLSPFAVWRSWSIDPHPADACFVALDEPDCDRVLGYGYLAIEGDTASHGFTALAREARGRGIAGSIKRAQIAWARAHGIRLIRTANELRLPHMIALNERLGYRRLHTELVLRGPA